MPNSFILRDWQSFYVLTGTASATLIGLIFIAISFGARLVPTQADSSVRAFVSPTVIHFGMVLNLSILTMIPSYTPFWLALMLLGVGAIGINYLMGVLRQLWIHHQKQQPLNLHHWSWHLLYPLLSYLVVCASGAGLLLGWGWMLNSLALAVTGLIVIGLRNTFDLMMWIARQPV